MSRPSPYAWCSQMRTVVPPSLAAGGRQPPAGIARRIRLGADFFVEECRDLSVPERPGLDPERRKDAGGLPVRTSAGQARRYHTTAEALRIGGEPSGVRSEHLGVDPLVEAPHDADAR